MFYVDGQSSWNLSDKSQNDHISDRGCSQFNCCSWSHFKSCTYILFTDLESSASGISTVWAANILNSDVPMLALWFLTIDSWLVHWAGWFPFFTVVCICLDSVLLVSRFLKWIHCAKFNILLVASAVHAHN